MNPHELSSTRGAQVACGFGAVYETIEKVRVSGADAVLVTGLGPVGPATAMHSGWVTMHPAWFCGERGSTRGSGCAGMYLAYHQA